MNLISPTRFSAMRTRPANISRAFTGRTVRIARTVRAMNASPRLAVRPPALASTCATRVASSSPSRSGRSSRTAKSRSTSGCSPSACSMAARRASAPTSCSRTLGVTYKTAWFLAHRIREAMNDENPARLVVRARSLKATKPLSAASSKQRACPARSRPRRKLSPLSSAKAAPARSTSPTSTTRNIRAVLVTNAHRSSHLHDRRCALLQ